MGQGRPRRLAKAIAALTLIGTVVVAVQAVSLADVNERSGQAEPSGARVHDGMPSERAMGPMHEGMLHEEPAMARMHDEMLGDYPGMAGRCQAMMTGT
jgi:hypothetical protein